MSQRRRRLHPMEVVAGIAGLVVALHRLGAEHAQYVVFSDRDLLRAAQLWERFPVTGAEMSYGTGNRIPGGASLYVLSPFALAGLDPVWAYRAMVAADLLGTLMLVLLCRPVLGRTGLLVGAAWFTATQAAHDSLDILWNPGWVPAFAALATGAAVRLTVEDRTRWWALFGAAVGLGGQMHLTVYLPALVGFGLLLARRPGVRGPLAAVGAWLLAYLPFLVVEGPRAFPSLRGASRQGAVLVPDAGEPWADHLAGWWGSMSAAQDGALAGVLGPLAPVAMAWVALPVAVFSVGVAVAAVRDPTRRPVALGALLALWGPLLWFAVSRQVGLQTTNTGRYFVTLGPLVAVAAAVMWDHAGGRARWALTLVLTPPLLLGALTAAEDSTLDRFPGSTDLAVHRDMLTHAAAATGRPPTDLLDRLVLVGGRAGEHVGWIPSIGLTYLAWSLSDGPFPAPQPAPQDDCWAFVPDRGELPLDRVDVAALYGPHRPHVTVEDTVALDARRGLVRYTPEDAWCLRNLGDVYVPTAEERAARDGGDAVDGVADVPAVGPDRPGFPIGITVSRIGLDLAVTLHANALRGEAPANGFGPFATVRELTVHVGGSVDAPSTFAPVLVGHRGVTTPLTFLVPLAADHTDPIIIGGWVVDVPRRPATISPHGGVPFAVEVKAP